MFGEDEKINAFTHFLRGGGGEKSLSLQQPLWGKKQRGAGWVGGGVLGGGGGKGKMKNHLCKERERKLIKREMALSSGGLEGGNKLFTLLRGKEELRGGKENPRIMAPGRKKIMNFSLAGERKRRYPDPSLDHREEREAFNKL